MEPSRPDLAGILLLAVPQVELERSDEAVVVVDARTREVVFRNDEARRIAASQGWPESVTLREGRTRMLHPDGRPVRDEERPTRRALQDGEEVVGMPALTPCIDGSVLSIVVSAWPLRGDSGEIVGAKVTFREVRDDAERVRLFQLSEQGRAATQERRALIALLDDAIRDLATPEEIVSVSTQLVGKHLRVTECYYGVVDFDTDLVRIFQGYSANAMPRDGNYRLSTFGRILERQKLGFTDAVDDTLTDPRTSESYFETYGPMAMRAFIGVPLIKNGRFVAFFTVNQSEPRVWTEDEVRLVEAVAARTWMPVDHMEALRALREREAQLRALIEGIPQFVWRVDLEGNFEYIGPQWQAYTGLGPEQNRGLPAREAIHPDDLEPVRAAWYRAIANGEMLDVEMRIRRADGVYRYFNARALPVRNGGGQAVEWMGTTTDIHEMRMMREALEERSAQLSRSYGETFDRLVRASTLRDNDTASHTSRVGRLACRIATRLGFSEDDAQELGRAAELHDLGKVGISDAILHKPDRLTDDERRTMETHTTLGASLLGGGESSLLRRATTIALSHHERWDGEGYPRRLKGEAIPLDGRIVALADAFDAMTSDRPYRSALPVEEARARIVEGRGSQWDPRVVDAFLQLDGD